MLDAQTTISILATFVVPLIVAILFITLIIHDIMTNNWDDLSTYLKILGGIVAGYILKNFQMHGMDKN